MLAKVLGTDATLWLFIGKWILVDDEDDEEKLEDDYVNEELEE